jgi:hypothetical protein
VQMFFGAALEELVDYFHKDVFRMVY